LHLDFYKKEFVLDKHFYQKSFSDKNCSKEILKYPIDVKSIISQKYDDALSCKVLLSKDEEYQIFRKYNYLKYRIKKISRDKKLGKDKKILEIKKRLDITKEIKELLIICNTRLMVKPIYRYFAKHDQEYEIMFSNGCGHLLKCIDYFDFRKGYKFSTYFVNVLHTNFFRDHYKITKAKKGQELIPNYNEEKFIEDYRVANQDYNQKFVMNMLNNEDLCKKTNYKIRKKIIIDYFGLFGKRAKKRSEIAKEIGVTKQTVGNIINDSIQVLKSSNLVYDPLI